MLKEIFRAHFKELHSEVDQAVSPERYKLLRRKIVGLMGVVTIIPLVLLAAITTFEHQAALNKEIQNPLRVLVNKTRNSFELFLAERSSTVSLIASAYGFEELSDEKTLARIFRVMRREFEGFVDLGLIDQRGIQLNYVGPYDLKGKDYSEQSWFHQVRLKNKYVSDVFMGFRRFPHVVIAVQHTAESGRSWVLRATIDTKQFDKLISAMSIEPDGDAFLLNAQGVLQTNTNGYGQVLDRLPFPLPPLAYETTVETLKDNRGREVFVACSAIPETDFVLVAVKPRGELLKAWNTVRGDLLFIFFAGVAGIFLVVCKTTDMLIKRMKESEDRREIALREVEHAHKLSSIGRLAAGVAHEVNNPLAIINEKAGLMQDLIRLQPEFPTREKFLQLVDGIRKAVDRCKGITHRMLGFARRMEVHVEDLDVNEVIRETVAFLENEAVHRKISVALELDAGLPRIASDRSQLQQVFLNILNNALAAVADAGSIWIATGKRGDDQVQIRIQDNGCGMSEETMQHIFEPFFTTKKDKGTGLGLSITYGIIKRLGGDIVVESAPNCGTTLTIFLPTRQQDGANR